MPQYHFGAADYSLKKEIAMGNEKLPENLVALIYSPKHSAYPQVTDEQVSGLEIDLKKNEWSCPNSFIHYLRQPQKIGEANYFAKEVSAGVIGVYDRTNLKHLTKMVKDWQENEENKHRNWYNVD